jgi:hypothetical protein
MVAVLGTPCAIKCRLKPTMRRLTQYNHKFFSFTAFFNWELILKVIKIWTFHSSTPWAGFELPKDVTCTEQSNIKRNLDTDYVPAPIWIESQYADTVAVCIHTCHNESI